METATRPNLGCNSTGPRTPHKRSGRKPTTKDPNVPQQNSITWNPFSVAVEVRLLWLEHRDEMPELCSTGPPTSPLTVGWPLRDGKGPQMSALTCVLAFRNSGRRLLSPGNPSTQVLFGCSSIFTETQLVPQVVEASYIWNLIVPSRALSA